MVEFQKLLHKIKEFKEGIDYTFKEQELLNNQQYEKEEVYLLQSPTIKEEARKIMFEEFEDNENGVGVFARIGKEESGKWYDYQRGDNEADQFSIKTIRPSELEKRRKEREKNRKEFEKKGKEFKESSKDKKCAFCGKEIDQSQGIRSLGSKVDKLYFCFAGDCSKNYFKQNNNNNQMKCDECGSVPSGDYWGFFIVDGKTYCDSCSKKIPKTPQKSELEREQEKLENLKDKYKNAFNQVEKDNLKKTIEETENHIKNLRANNNSTEQPTKNNLGKYLLGGSVILGGITLIFILVIRRRKKKNHN